MSTNQLSQIYYNRIQSQMGLSDKFTILMITKQIESSYTEQGSPEITAHCTIPEDWYLVTVQDSKKGFINRFVRLGNVCKTIQ